MTFGKHPSIGLFASGTNLVIRGLEVLVSSPCLAPPQSPQSLGGLESNQLPMTNKIYLLWLCWAFCAACWLSLVVVSGDFSLVAVHGLIVSMASRACGLQ